MTKLVRVKAGYDIQWPSSVKREALMFSQVAILQCGHMSPHVSDEIEWLIDQGIVFQTDKYIEDQQLKDCTEDKLREYYEYCYLESKYWNYLQDLYNSADSRQLSSGAVIGQLSDSESRIAKKIYGLLLEYQLRIISAKLRAVDNINAYPVLHSDWILQGLGYSKNDVIQTSDLIFKQHKASKNDVIQIVLKSLPIPDDSTPWEQILDYRNDPTSQGKFLALNNWMNEVARAELTPVEIEEKLEWLIYDYQSHMHLHRLKTSAGTLEIVVTTAAEFLENLITIKWSRAAKALFSLKHRRITLMEAEIDSPGSEIAYIVRTRQEFV